MGSFRYIFNYPDKRVDKESSSENKENRVLLITQSRKGAKLEKMVSSKVLNQTLAENPLQNLCAFASLREKSRSTC